MDQERKTLVAFQCTEAQQAALELLASQRNQSVSQLIREILATRVREFAPMPIDHPK